jgi:hypothetical protein
MLFKVIQQLHPIKLGVSIRGISCTKYSNESILLVPSIDLTIY